MAVICITGSASPQLQAVEYILLQAGMQVPRPVPKEEPLDILQWQHHVLTSIDGESSGGIQDPGRLWELLAGEIVLANLKSPLWGWFDPASIRFLDFWLRFSPEFKFVLVCQTPQQLLAESLVNSGVPLNVEDLLSLWNVQHQEMLRFHHRNPERSILIYASDAVANPDLLLAECSKRWNLSLCATGIDALSSVAPPDALASFFSYRFPSLQPEIDYLNREIMATAAIFSPAKVEDLTDEPQLEEIFDAYLSLRQQISSGELKFRCDLELLQSEQVSRAQEQQKEIELLLLQLTLVQTELETVFLQEQAAQGQIDVLKKEMSVAMEERTTLSAKCEDLEKKVTTANQAREENSLILSERQAQIDQLSKARDEQSKLAADRHAAIATLTKGRDDSTKQLTERQAQIDQLSKDRDQQKKLAEEQQQENELLLLQLHLVQEELESVFLKEVDSKQQVENLIGERTALVAKTAGLTKEITALKVARDEQSKLAADRQAAIVKLTKEQDEATKQLSEQKTQIGHLTKDRDQQKKLAEELQKQRDVPVRECEEQISRLQSEMKEEQQENELLLLQLHQVQEELERYFLQYQQIQQQYSVTNSTFHRLLERDPKFYDYEDLEVAAENRGDAIPSVNCRLANLTAAGRHFPTLVFSLAIEQGGAGLIFPAATMANFLRPLLPSAGESELVISPQRLDQLATLATSDWFLVTTLVRLLNESLVTPTRLQWNSSLNNSIFLAGLQELARQMEPYEARLRYDEIKLKREQVNPDYEHLWFEFANLSFAGEIWSHFEFRLSCAHVRPDYFGGFPKLEFPAEGSQAPFEGWFIEANDDFGDKLELRFSVADKGMDLAVWERVTAHDRAFMHALVAEIPGFLSALQQSEMRIARPWNDWRAMAAEMQSIMTSDAAVTTSTLAPTSDRSDPAGLHYDKAKLKREQVNPDYEHLWFEFGNLSFQGESWPHFEFRLSCAHVRPDYFGGFPKLEFPAEGSQAPFEGWFVEARDDFGDKLELRFSLPDKALDLAVWERVTEHDRAFMKALVAELPRILATLRQSGIKIRRPWEDWTKMAVEMMPIVINSAKPKGKKKSSFKKMLRRLKM